MQYIKFSAYLLKNDDLFLFYLLKYYGCVHETDTKITGQFPDKMKLGFRLYVPIWVLITHKLIFFYLYILEFSQTTIILWMTKWSKSNTAEQLDANKLFSEKLLV